MKGCGLIDWSRCSRGDVARWGGSLLMVLASCAGATAGWLAREEVSTAAAETPAAVMIEMAPLPVAARQQTEQPPGPERKEQKIKPKPVQKAPLPRAEQAEVALRREVQPEPSRPTPAEQTTAPPTAPAPPDQKTAAPAAGAAPAPSSDALPSWQGVLLAHLERLKRYPAVAQQRRQRGVAYLYFVVDRTGKVLEYRLERSSGFALLDEEALALLQRAQPLPPPPPELAKDRIALSVPVEFFIR